MAHVIFGPFYKRTLLHRPFVALSLLGRISRRYQKHQTSRIRYASPASNDYFKGSVLGAPLHNTRLHEVQAELQDVTLSSSLKLSQMCAKIKSQPAYPSICVYRYTALIYVPTVERVIS